MLVLNRGNHPEIAIVPILTPGNARAAGRVGPLATRASQPSGRGRWSGRPPVVGSISVVFICTTGYRHGSLMPVLDLDRLRHDPVYRLIWITRLAIATLVVAGVLAVGFWSGLYGA